MKLSKITHAMMIVAGIVGGLALVAAWLATGSGRFMGLDIGFLYTNALNLQIVAISAGIGTLVRMKLEKEGSSYL